MTINHSPGALFDAQHFRRPELAARTISLLDDALQAGEFDVGDHLLDALRALVVDDETLGSTSSTQRPQDGV